MQNKILMLLAELLPSSRSTVWQRLVLTIVGGKKVVVK